MERALSVDRLTLRLEPTTHRAQGVLLVLTEREEPGPLLVVPLRLTLSTGLNQPAGAVIGVLGDRLRFPAQPPPVRDA